MTFQSNGPSSGTPLALLSESSFTQLINEAFRHYHSTLALSRSALANSALILPTLVVDEASPSAEERGRGLRLLLRWAVEQIAPGSVAFPVGIFRPFDDPTWSEPLWWRYNILRHRYLDPLHPDDFVDGGRYTETLMALTGITSTDAFFDERNRAIREVADRLRQQLMDGAANQTLQQMALAETVQLLAAQEEATTLLGIAAVFDEIFPRSLLLAMATEEQVLHSERALNYLIKNRLLLVGDDQRHLLLSTTLRAYFYQRQPADRVQRRHRAVANFYSDHDDPLLTVRHWFRAGQSERAAAILFAEAEALVHELQGAELIEALLQFTQRSVADTTWREIQILLSDLYYRTGQPEDAVAACRRALQVAEDVADQARIYRRLGKLYATRNQLHALTYYQQAAERFAPTNPELADLLKDRGWLHILRRNWQEAERDLTLALSIAQTTAGALQADVMDALASLYRRQQRFDVALEQARRALEIRESSGNLPRIASSFNNLGNIYRDMGEYWHAISAYQDALGTYQKMGNVESMAGAFLNMGMAHHLLQEYTRAIDLYNKCLALCQEHTLPHVEANVRYNLAETYAALGQPEPAVSHWQLGYELSQQAGFTDEIHAYEQLRAETPLLQQQPSMAIDIPTALSAADQASFPSVPPEERQILELAQRFGRITAKDLIDELSMSRATATRRLSALAESGHLQQQGRGRGTHYMVTKVDEGAAVRDQRGEKFSGSVPAVMPANFPETWWSQLALQQAKLRKQFAIETIEPMQPLAVATLPRLIVRFSQTPTLAEFMALRSHIETLLGTEVDLVPQLA